MVAVCPFEATRTDWMSDVGKRIYSEYAEKVLGETPRGAVDLSDIRNETHSQLMHVAHTVAERITRTETEWGDANPLFKHTQEILRYTAASDPGISFNPDGDTDEDKIRIHNEDSWKFAASVTMGAAYDVVARFEFDSLIDPIPPVSAKKVAAVLRNPSLDDAVSILALPGYGVIGDAGAPGGNQGLEGLDGYRMEIPGMRVDDPLLAIHGVKKKLKDFESGEITVTEAARTGLIDLLREKNNEVMRRDKSDDPSDPPDHRFGGMRGFSRGCPVIGTEAFKQLRLFLSKTLDLTLVTTNPRRKSNPN